MAPDKALIKKRFAATFRQYNLLAITQQEICRELASMMAHDAVAAMESSQAPGAGEILRMRTPESALEVGAGTGFMTRLLAENYPATRWILNDLAAESESYLEAYLENVAHSYLWGDAEAVEFPAGLDMVVSASTVQWFDDLPAFLRKCAAATHRDGYLALSTFGPQNFAQIKALTGRGLHYYTMDEIERMVEHAGYVVLQSRQYTRDLAFATGVDVLRHIKATGVNSLEGRSWTKGRLDEFSRRYMESFAVAPSAENPSGGVSLTYHPVLITARKK